METKEAISRLQTLLDTEISFVTKQAILAGIESLTKEELHSKENNTCMATTQIGYSNDTKANKVLFAVFDAGYKSCVKETLNWLREKGDDYVWFLEEDGGLTEDLYEDLERYLNGRLDTNDL